MNIQESNTVSSDIVNQKLHLINWALLNIIDEIVSIDENTIGIKLAKNLVIYNEGSIVNINKGYNVQIAKEVHLNPVDVVKNFEDKTVLKMLDFNKE